MGRRNKQTDLEDAIKQKNGAGHNSTLTDDERRALTLHHKRAYEAAPVHLTAEGSQRWIENWHAGQAVLASAFGKKRGTVEAEPTKTEAAPPAQEPQTEAATAH